MIRLKTMKWAHAFSYGPNNSIDFSSYPLLQLVGKNGHGKSSIALILEEVLFNKNSKGIKKADILNRYVSDKVYTIELNFSKDADEYTIKTSRSSTQTVKLFKNGEDISAHTATNTYKMIEDILGFDHKTFTQIVYQSSAYNLEFLVATDTNRKKFLIDLLNLSIYTKAADIFKTAAKDLGIDCEAASTKVKTVTDWLTKLSKEDLSLHELKEVPDTPTDLLAELAEIDSKLLHIETTNKKIVQNNKYKEILASIVLQQPLAFSDVAITDLTKLVGTLDAEHAKLDKVIRGIGPILTKCNSCGQPIDNSHKVKMVADAKIKIEELEVEQGIANGLLKVETAKKIAATKANNIQLEWEKYHGLIDHTISNIPLDKEALLDSKKNIADRIVAINTVISTNTKANITAVAHNTRVEVLSGQIGSMESDLKIYSERLEVLRAELVTIQLLVKTFSTTGLVSYKIECLVKDLEEITNNYLLDMSDGRFQLSFKVNSSDKLNVIITDNGTDIDILALSNGERARVNISTLLAIRTLMQSISDSRINLLILDETVESLDADGKEKLIEVLLKEEYLNTVLVSHGFSHPLLEKINILKENNISRLE